MTEKFIAVHSWKADVGQDGIQRVVLVRQDVERLLGALGA
jgi:hypothetical protein